MGSLRLTLCAGAVVAAALTGAAPPAQVADPGGVSVVPASPAPGSDIRVRAEGCGGRSGTAVSKAFVSDARLTQLTGEDIGTLAGETRVRSSLEPGTYDVRITCDGREDKLKGTVKVGDRKPAGAGPPAVEPSAVEPAAVGPSATGSPATTATTATRLPAGEPVASPRSSAPASPVAPVRAGGGGAAARLTAVDAADSVGTEGAVGAVGTEGSEDPANSMDSRHTGPGTPHAVVGLVLAGVAAVVVVARGARRGRGRRTE
ncbi:hypothetical protein [Streptomyces sp. NPDC012510]|uniref:hypothetical protein n=1 Tax=Streptomyces sp. NPDC012510 TaxID=3364838 RepID=UPI0036EE6716